MLLNKHSLQSSFLQIENWGLKTIMYKINKNNIFALTENPKTIALRCYKVLDIAPLSETYAPDFVFDFLRGLQFFIFLTLIFLLQEEVYKI